MRAGGCFPQLAALFLWCASKNGELKGDTLISGHTFSMIVPSLSSQPGKRSSVGKEMLAFIQPKGEILNKLVLPNYGRSWKLRAALGGALRDTWREAGKAEDGKTWKNKGPLDSLACFSEGLFGYQT